MSQETRPFNSHIEDYLEYFRDLAYPPKFAVLLKGKWGSGKTWFIEQYRKKLEEKQAKKSLYISLYGVNNFSEIEESLFQQLHPVLASKQMVLAGKLFKGFLKGTLKFDLTDDNKDDGTWSFSIPDIELEKKFKDSNFSLLIFDDLERSNLEIESLLGYIHSFVESQNLKVVIIANEEQIKELDEYKKIKEKVIGKTFEVAPNFQEALRKFIEQVKSQEAKERLLENASLIEDFYTKGECKNLRTLNMVILDFERIFENLPEKAKSHSELIQDVLEILIIFSIEISHAKINPSSIGEISAKLSAEIASSVMKTKDLPTDSQGNNSKETISYREIFKKYGYFGYDSKLNSLFPSLLWWQDFFDKGIVDKSTLEELLLNSKYFQHETTANWVKLWHYTRNTDDEFQDLLNNVDLEYTKREFDDLVIIKQITGLFLVFSDMGLYNKTKQNILDEAKVYIDDLKRSNKLDFNNFKEDEFGSYGQLGYLAERYPEFTEFSEYVKQIVEEAKIKNLPNEANELLNLMQNDIYKFHSKICVSNSNISGNKYYNFPIFCFVLPEDFVKAVLRLPNYNISHIFYSIEERYEHKEIAIKLIKELDFLNKVQELLLAEIPQRKLKLSESLLNKANKEPLKNAIASLEQIKQSRPQNLQADNSP